MDRMLPRLQAYPTGAFFDKDSNDAVPITLPLVSSYHHTVQSLDGYAEPERSESLH